MTVWLAAASGSFGQTARPSAERSEETRPLTKAEGRLIVLATSSAARDVEDESDCSHLVHDLYEQAGFRYEYVSSRDLYTGNANFVRVHHPQPGDLIVWRGHVGIVIDPREHSFFSSLRTGADTQFYDSAYWRARGAHRFYRYVTDKRLRPPKTLEASRHPDDAPVLASDRRSEYRPPARSPEESASASGEVPAPAPTGEALAEIAGGVVPVVPRQKVLQISGKTPAAGEIAAALSELNGDSGQLLRSGDLAAPGQPIIVYSQLQVIHVRIKGSHGTAHARLESLAALPPSEPAVSRPQWRDLPLSLQKTKTGWTLSPMDSTLFVPRDVALRILAARLAALAQNADAGSPEEREQTQIIRFLNLLVPDNPASTSTRADN